MAGWSAHRSADARLGGTTLLAGDIDFDDNEGDAEDSVAKEVLAKLDMLDANLVTVEDVPVYLEFLDTRPGDFADGYRRFLAALSTIDYPQRRQNLARQELYGPFCGG